MRHPRSFVNPAPWHLSPGCTLAIAISLLMVTRSAAADPPAPPEQPTAAIDHGDTAWMLVSTGLVMLMVPGLALFYGGMVRRKNVLGTMMHSMVALAIIGIQWVLFGYCLAFGESQGGLASAGTASSSACRACCPTQVFPGTNIPIYVHCMYQGMFAIITPALISGAIAERIRFGPYCLFILLWAHARLRPAGPLGLGACDWPKPAIPAGWLGKMGGARLRGRHRGPHRGRPFRPGGHPGAAQAHRLSRSTPCTPTAWC